MTKEQIETEVKQEFDKKIDQLASDVIDEANTLPKNPAPEKENLDLIKHLLKKMAVHQLIIEKQAKKTNLYLLILTVIITILTGIMAF